MIPQNDANVQQLELESQAKFDHEIEILEEHVFNKPIEGFKDVGGVPVMRMQTYETETRTIDGLGKFKATPEHMKRLVENIKAAGYFVYLKEYHNGHYGTTEPHTYYIAKARLNATQRESLGLHDTWDTPSGPGRDSFRGVLL